MPAKKALLVIDSQVALFHLSKPLHKSDIVLANIRALIDQARASSVPIIYLQHSGSQNGIFGKGSPGWHIHPSISPRQGEIVVEKHKPDAFCGTLLEQYLNELSVQTLVVCGFVTEGCVDTTVRRASSLGFKIELVGDAHSTTDGEVLGASQIVDHHNSILAIFAEVKKANEVHFEP
jgi:nicotinamidase-related amidase